MKFKIHNLKFIIIAAILLCVPKQIHAATLYTQTGQQDVFEGQTFVVSWYLDTENLSINSLDLKINYSKDTLHAVEATAGDSLVSLWIRNPSIDDSNGSIALTGGIPNGANSNHVQIFRSTFEAIKSGAANISIDANSIVLANDGQGTTIPVKFAPVQFMIEPKNFIPNQISSKTHPDQNRWYQNRDVVIDFQPKEKTDYSFSFSSNIDIIPDDNVAPAQTEFKYSKLPDGIYYFKVNSKVGPSNLPAGQAGWSEAGVYRVQIDATPPENFTPIISSDNSVFNGAKFLSFSTVDKTSGISHYKVKAGLFGFLIETQSPSKLQKPLVGDEVTVKAFDAAGNVREKTIAWQGYLSVSQFVWLLIFIGLIAIGFYFKKKNAK